MSRYLPHGEHDRSSGTDTQPGPRHHQERKPLRERPGKEGDRVRDGVGWGGERAKEGGKEEEE